MSEKNIGLLIARILLGVTFFLHGFAKFQGGISGTAEFFGSVGLSGALAYIVAIIELVGGILMILGLFTKVISLLFIVVMLGAIGTVKLEAGFLDGFELELTLIALSIATYATSTWTKFFDPLATGQVDEVL
ncbi:Putative oxidoreductase CatD [Metalysinibacillus saudimassiliensis]|uniref:Putative oxidoreductase CatD n=1 Tax=Metalysinibacillus saudimassiliensis TaxID=1461583 RepID=A0A078MHY3_9BACL|nr:Putative oxidoreductase CatD [Metalysinibacillus saudimassiliensis]